MDINPHMEKESPNIAINKAKAKDYDMLMNELQQKVESANCNEKLTLLTLKPNSWSFAKIEHFLKVTYYYVEEAIKLKQEKIFCQNVIQLKEKQSIFEGVKKLVQEFYLEPEYSHILPEQKDSVT